MGLTFGLQVIDWNEKNGPEILFAESKVPLVPRFSAKEALSLRLTFSGSRVEGERLVLQGDAPAPRDTPWNVQKLEFHPPQ